MKGWEIILLFFQLVLSFIAGWQIYDWVKERRISEGDTP